MMLSYLKGAFIAIPLLFLKSAQAMEAPSESLLNQSDVAQDITLINVSDLIKNGLSVDQALNGIFPHIKLDITRTPGMLQSFKSNTNLVTLSLRANYIGDLGAKIMGGVLKTNKTITTLNLDYNLITAVGMKDLAEGLRENTTLTTLTLNYNEIFNDGVGHLAEVLKRNQTLTSLGLEFNRITDEGIGYLVDTLSVNTSLVTLNLCDNFICAQDARLLHGVMKERKEPLALNLSNNFIEIEREDDIKKFLLNYDHGNKSYIWHGNKGRSKLYEKKHDGRQLLIRNLLAKRLQILSKLKKLYDQPSPNEGTYLCYKHELDSNDICLLCNMKKNNAEELDSIFRKDHKWEIITKDHIINVILSLKKRILDEAASRNALDSFVEKLKTYEEDIIFILGESKFLTSVSELKQSDYEDRELA